MSTRLFDLVDTIAQHTPAGTYPRVARIVSDHRPGQHIVFRLEPGDWGYEYAISVDDGADRYWALIDVGTRLCIPHAVEVDPEAARLIAKELIAWADYRDGTAAP